MSGILTFAGGVDSVTGANFLLHVGGKNMLTDCGFYQSSHKMGDDRNREAFPFDPKDIDILFVTHAHIDHIGRIPKLVREGFRGEIISTWATKDLAELMLHDTVDILRREAEHEERDPIYTAEDVVESMKLWRTRGYYEQFSVGENITVEFKEAGHMLGSVMVFVTTNSGGAARTIVFTGDLGNSPAPLLRDTDPITGAHYVVMESVYGDRNHEHRDERKEVLRQVIVNAVKDGGTLVVPAFSMERTQELLYELNDFAEHHTMPRIPVFVDSPLAIKATDVYRRADEFFNKEAQHIISTGDSLFNFPGLHFTETKEESMAIWEHQGPKMIMAGSGMATGGRIVHHLKHYLPKENTTVLLAGYQAVGTPGRLMQEGVKTLVFHGEETTVRANILSLQGYSGHKDSNGLVDFAETGMETVEKYFLVMGEPKASMFLAQRIRDELGKDAVVPRPNDKVTLDL